MSCDKFTDAIGAMIEGSLDPAGRRALDEHLASCGACRALVSDIRRIHREAAALPRLTPPDALWMKVRERLKAQVSAVPADAPGPQAETPPVDARGPVPARSWERLAAWFRPLTASPLRAAAFSSAVVLVLTAVTVLVLFRQPAIAPSGYPTVGSAGTGGAGGAGTPAGNAQGDQLVQSVEMELKLA